MTLNSFTFCVIIFLIVIEIRALIKKLVYVHTAHLQKANQFEDKHFIVTNSQMTKLIVGFQKTCKYVCEFLTVTFEQMFFSSF